jgi:hypothetical protein
MLFCYAVDCDSASCPGQRGEATPLRALKASSAGGGVSGSEEEKVAKKRL